MSLVTITLDADDEHAHERTYTSDRFLVFWRDQFGTIRFAAAPDGEEEWEEIMNGIEQGEIGVFEEDD